MTTQFQQYLENTPDAEIHQTVSQLGSSSVESDIRELEKKMSKSPDWRTDIFDKMLVLLPDHRLGMIYKVRTIDKNDMEMMLHWYLVVAE